ncbi:MAG: DUF993 family protein [Phycisphaerales bacterium]|nr:DUF993 family protein [Phycisphaerales bacterium]
MTGEAVTLPDGSTCELPDDPWAGIAARLPEGAPARLVYAAAHIAMRDTYASVAHSPEAPGRPSEIAPHIHWDATVGFRRHLIARGFGIAEAMDTAQRYEIGWTIARELIERCGRLRPPMGFIAGAGTDQLAAIRSTTDIIDAMTQQCAVIRGAGGWPMLLAQPWLSQHHADPDTYVEVYTRLISQTEGPLFIHWLGPMFLPALDGYFPGDSFDRIMAFDPAKVRGCKLSMLDAALERRLRVRLAQRDQIMLTGDDFHFGALMEGAPTGATAIDGRAAALGDLSHGLLGVFDGIAEPASIALRALAAGDLDAYRTIMRPCEALGRVIFEPPTQHYKAGLAFLAYLNGHQPNPMLVNHAERARDTDHLCCVVRAGAACGAIPDRPAVCDRLRRWAANPDGSWH